MKKIVDTIQIPLELNNYIESLNYEVECRKSLLAFAMEKGLVETDSFKRYDQEYRECYMKFDIAKQDMYDKYIKDKWDGKDVNWQLSYNTGIVEISEEG